MAIMMITGDDDGVVTETQESVVNLVQRTFSSECECGNKNGRTLSWEFYVHLCG